MHRTQRGRLLVAILVAMLPFFAIRRLLYRTLLKYDIDAGSRIAPFTVLVARKVTMRGARIGMFNMLVLDQLDMAAGSRIRMLNRAQGIRTLRLAEDAFILNSNFIGGTWGGPLQTGDEVLDLGPRSQLTLRAFVDLNDSVSFGADVVAGGVGTQFWTHGFDCYRNRVRGAIRVADTVFIGAGCMVLPNVSICSEVTVGAGSVVHRPIIEPGLYVSSQLVQKG
tara:strand:+ start:308 stop:976 length:669 start_codon:yes stop_codon:yes gene_type:complete